MKKTIFLLLLLAKVYAATAGNPYLVTATLQTSTTYACKVAPNALESTPAFTDLDLVTWIFPDGQYQQSIIHVNSSGVVPGTDMVQWQPYQNAPSGPDSITVYVAKKGGQTNPGRGTVNFTNYLNIPPKAFDFPTGKNWQINRSWEFSPGNETFFILSYKPSASLPACTIGADGITLRFDPRQISLVNAYGFNKENLGTSGNIDFKIMNYPNGPIPRHVFFKVKSTTNIGDTIKIRAVARVCTGTTDSIDLKYVTMGGPHDPNKKTVNTKTITSTGVTKLTYSIQFQNDGNGIVNEVDVIDTLPPELNHTTFAPKGVTHNSNGVIKTLYFNSLNLHGLGERNPSYGYDQTIHRFSFEVTTKQNINTIIDNRAKIVFFQPNTVPPRTTPLPAIFTEIARVTPSPACKTMVNLATNGDFKAGNNGSFQSGWPTPKCNSCTAASFCVGNQFRSKCNSWPANSFDHTLGNANGSFLIFDGDPDKPATVWTSSVCVTKDQIYTFSFWAKSLYAEAFPLGMMIDGVLVNTVKVSQSTPTWTEYRVSWQAPSTKCLPIAIRQMTKGQKRDFGVDDVFFGYCKLLN